MSKAGPSETRTTPQEGDVISKQDIHPIDDGAHDGETTSTPRGRATGKPGKPTTRRPR